MASHRNPDIPLSWGSFNGGNFKMRWNLSSCDIYEIEVLYYLKGKFAKHEGIYIII